MLAHKPGPPRTPRVHVVGAGSMGARHVRVFLAAGADVTVDDIDPAKTRDVAGRLGARAGSSAAPDLVIVATPTPTHEDVAAEAFDRGAHVFVEKPLASTLAAAERLAARALAAHRFLFVGMSERFHPVVRVLSARVDPADVTRLTFHRFGSVPTTQPALLNLGVHDVDLALHLSRAELRVASARSLGPDATVVHLMTSRDGAIEAQLAAGGGPSRDRRLTVELRSGERYEGNLLTPALLRFRSSHDTEPAEIVPLGTDEPLFLQAAAVLAAIAGGDSGALASAADGVRVLRLVEAAFRALKTPAIPAAVPRNAAEKL